MTKKEFPFSEEEITELRKKIIVISKVLDDFDEEITAFGTEMDLIADFVAQKTNLSTLEVLGVFDFQRKLKEFVNNEE